MPILLAILTLAIQILFAIHVAKTGRSLFWIILIVSLPLVGCIAYFFAELLPEWRHHPSARRVWRSAHRTVAPEYERKKIALQLEATDTVENKLRLAKECSALGDYAHAEQLLKACLQGLHATDPDIMLLLAQAQFAQGDAQACKVTLDALKAENPSYRSSDGHLLYAKSLQQLGEIEHALQEYEVLVQGYPGEEARAQYGLLLQQQGKRTEAQVQFAEILKRVKTSPSYYRKNNRQWVSIAKTHQTL